MECKIISNYCFELMGLSGRIMAKKPKYEKIYEFYKEQILSNDLPPKAKLPTEMEIASKFEVSRITVIRALKDLEQEDLIERIQGSGSYVKETKGIQEDNSNLPPIISLVLPNDENFKPNFLKGIEEVAKLNNYFVTFHQTTNDPESEKKVILDLISHGSKGIILYPSDSPSNMEIYSKLLIKNFPLVLIDRKIPGLDLSIIWTDNQAGFYEITDHLIQLGHTKIIFVGTKVFTLSSELERYRGFCKAHIDHKITLLEKHLYSEEDVAEIPHDYQKGLSDEERAIHYLLDILEKLSEAEKPTAIAAVNDSIAELIIRIGLERNVAIPDHFSVTGFDNRLFAAHLPVPLTTLSQPTYEIGRQAAEELFNIIKNPLREPSEHKITGKLIIRKSALKYHQN